MLELTTVPQPAPAAAPNLDMTGQVAITAEVFPKRGGRFYVCNPFDELIEARESGEPFVAHTIVGMRPKRVLIEPGTIDRIEEN